MSYVESVQRAIDYIEDQLDQELDLANLADEAYMSVAQLYRVFYALTGHPVKEYIRKRRISAAACQLRNSSRPIEELAWDSGFESYHAFAKVFKKIVGLTPAAYRKAEIYYSFEPIRLKEQVSYKEDRAHTERYPDVKVLRFMPGRLYGYLHKASQEDGMEQEAFRIVTDKLQASLPVHGAKPKVRFFGHNVELPDEQGLPVFGYKMWIAVEETDLEEGFLKEEPFEGGLYAVRKVAAFPAEVVQDGWDRLLAEWLPKSTFELGGHPYLEEFIAPNGKLARMNLFLPVQRRWINEPIELVTLPAIPVAYSRGYGALAQNTAERRLIECLTGQTNNGRDDRQGTYYISYAYGQSDKEDYWWENGMLDRSVSGNGGCGGLEQKCFESGRYACCVTKTYGALTGVLDKMYAWITGNEQIKLDEERQWFAEYHLFEGRHVERDTIVKVYIPIIGGGTADEA